MGNGVLGMLTGYSLPGLFLFGCFLPDESDGLFDMFITLDRGCNGHGDRFYRFCPLFVNFCSGVFSKYDLAAATSLPMAAVNAPRSGNF